MALQTNNIKLGGYLVSKLITLGKTGAGKEFATARLTLEVGENQRVDLEIFSMRHNSSGAESKIYQNLMTIHQEYKSLDSQFVDKRAKKDAQPNKHEATTVASKEEVDFIYANKGIKLSNNRYVNANGELVTTFRLSANFINRAKPEQLKEPFVEGALTGVCEKDMEKIYNNDGDVVGAKVNLLVPEFRKGYTNAFGEEIHDSIAVERFEVVLRNLEGLDYCEEIFLQNKVCNISIEPVNRIEQETPQEQPRQRGFGKTVTFEPTTKIVREIQIVGCYDLEDHEYEDDEAFNFDLFQEGVKALDKKIEELQEGQGKTVEINKGFGRKSSPSSSAFNSDLPF